MGHILVLSIKIYGITRSKRVKTKVKKWSKFQILLEMEIEFLLPFRQVPLEGFVGCHDFNSPVKCAQFRTQR